MKAILIFLTILISYSTAIAQKLDIGIGTVLSERRTYQTPVDLDSIVFFERDYLGSGQLLPFIRYSHPINSYFEVSVGIQTQRNSAGLTVEKRATDSTFMNSKLTSAYLKGFEFPIAGHYIFNRDGDFQLRVFAGIIPIINKVDFDARFKEGPQYPASVAEALNKAGTLPKRFHMDYQVGGRLSYKRFNVDIYYQSNLTSNLNNNLEIWGHEFLYKRNTESVRLILSYSLPLTTIKK
ncbi:hypothetical protein AB9P05_07670 [Roseivirga sp. BDSF3-8]|uniref:hypothetical protein n=1 Tax=Roseivirga sp. BDSF3-8 TaxID=3241598 RepID=UPI003531DA73